MDTQQGQARRRSPKIAAFGLPGSIGTRSTVSRRPLALLAALVLGAFVAAPTSAVTTYSEYVVYGEHGVFIGAGSKVIGLVGARLNNADPTVYPGQPAAALGMNGGAQIIGTANIGEAGSSADVQVANGVTISQLFYVDEFNHGVPFTGTATQQPGGTDLPAAPLSGEIQWPGGLGTGCPAGPSPFDTVINANGATITLTPGTYGEVKAGGNSVLNFSGAGDYYIQRIQFGNGLDINVTPGTRVFVCDDVAIGGADVFPNTLLPGQFRMEVAGLAVAAGDNAFHSGGGTNWIGNVLVPSRGLKLGNGDGNDGTIEWYGSMLADHIDIEHGTVSTKPPTKAGVKWLDENGDGDRDLPEEVGLKGWTIQLRDSTNTNVVKSEVTDANGAYQFTDIVPGTYYVCEVQQPNYTQTYPNADTPDPVPGTDEVTDECPAPANYGYRIVVANGDDLRGDDFGNTLDVQEGGSKRGLKYRDMNNDGDFDLGIDVPIGGWPINLYKLNGAWNLVESKDTEADGTYEFVISENGTYRVCEGTQPNYTQVWPTAATTPPPGETITNQCPAPNIHGYQFTISGTENLVGNDFGNRLVTQTCPEDRNRAALLTRIVDLKRPVGGTGVAGDPRNYHTLQAAYNDAIASGQAEVIGMFSKTVENVVLGGDKALTITQCTSAMITAADPNQPAWKLTNAKKLLIIGPDSMGGTIGWELVTGGHELKSIRAYNASVAGVRIHSNGNAVSWNAISGNAIGLDVLGSNNTLKGSTISLNTGDGIHVGPAATKNTLSGATIQDNAGNGVFLEGSANTLSSNKLYRNKNGLLISGNTNTITSNLTEANNEDGVNVTGLNNQFKDNKQARNKGDGFQVGAGATGNKLTSNVSNTGSSGSSSENLGFEYNFLAAIVNGGSNKEDGSAFGSTAIGTYE